MMHWSLVMAIRVVSAYGLDTTFLASPVYLHHTPIYKWFSHDIPNIHWLNPYVHGQLFNKECTALSTKDVCAGGGETAAELAADIMKAFWIRAASAKVPTSSRSFLYPDMGLSENRRPFFCTSQSLIMILWKLPENGVSAVLGQTHAPGRSPTFSCML